MATFDFARVEATHLDYKIDLEREKPKSWLKTVSAFANTSGGHILFGVTNDTHQAVGLERAQEVASKIAELIRDRVEPAPRYQLTEFDSETPGRICLDLYISAGPAYPYYYAHERVREVYVRHGDRSEIASINELNHLILKGQNRTFDGLPSHYKLPDVSFTLFNATYKKESGEELVLPRDLISMGLVTEDGQVTNAGLLLCDQGYLKQSRIVCTRWKGCEKGAVDGDALDDQEFTEASLISLLTNAEAFIRNNSKNPWTVRGMQREEKSDYPFRAVREVLVNGMIHRDYQIVGTEVHVDMFDDRMEISSPGGMLNGSRIQDLDLRRVPSMRRNEIISDLFGRLHFMDRRGSGIGRILNSYVEFHEQPQFFSNEFFFVVTLPNRSVARAAQDSSDTEETQSSNQISQLRLEKTQLRLEKTQLSSRKLNSAGELEDWEMSYFRDVTIKKNGLQFRQRTIEKLLTLFDRYRYNYSFNRRNIADLFGITENGASGFIKKCQQRGIIRKVRVDEYQFVYEQEDAPKEDS